jgi:hypothetical protein
MTSAMPAPSGPLAPEPMQLLALSWIDQVISWPVQKPGWYRLAVFNSPDLKKKAPDLTSMRSGPMLLGTAGARLDHLALFQSVIDQLPALAPRGRPEER